MENVTIQLLGREYKVAVKPGEKETLKAAIDLVTERFQRMADKAASGNEALAVMAALGIAHEFVVAQRVAAMDMPVYRTRVVALGERIDDVLARQKTRF